MHVLLGVLVLAALVWFVFGEQIARFFVGSVLALGAAVGLFLLYIATVNVNRQEALRTRYVATIPAKDLARIWQNIEERDARGKEVIQ